MLPFVHGKTFITVATGGLEPSHSALMGNFLNPAYVSNHQHDYLQPYSLIDKLKNVFYTILLGVMWDKVFQAPVQVEVGSYFLSNFF